MSADFANLDPAEIYARVSPEQRAAIAQQFQQGFQQSGNPASQQFTAINPDTTSPQQLAEMHKHARAEHKGLFGAVMNHPVASIALGAFAAYEIEQHLNHKQ